LKSTIQLSSLPAHSGIQLKFLLAIIDTWDGNAGDFFHVDIDGTSRFKETFGNGATQSYTAPPGALIDHNVNRAVEIWSDSLYNMGLDTARFGSIPHTASTLWIDFYADGSNWDRPANESWAIDNVEVDLIGVPEPSTLLLAPMGTLIFCQRMKKPQR
jgi:hypothetical protein